MVQRCSLPLSPTLFLLHFPPHSPAPRYRASDAVTQRATVSGEKKRGRRGSSLRAARLCLCLHLLSPVFHSLPLFLSVTTSPLNRHHHDGTDYPTNQYTPQPMRSPYGYGLRLKLPFTDRWPQRHAASPGPTRLRE